MKAQVSFANTCASGGLEHYRITIDPRNNGNNNQISLVRADGPLLLTVDFYKQPERTRTYHWSTVYMPKTKGFIKEKTRIINDKLQPLTYQTRSGWKPYNTRELPRDFPAIDRIPISMDIPILPSIEIKPLPVLEPIKIPSIEPKEKTDPPNLEGIGELLKKGLIMPSVTKSGALSMPAYLSDATIKSLASQINGLGKSTVTIGVTQSLPLSSSDPRVGGANAAIQSFMRYELPSLLKKAGVTSSIKVN